MGLPPGCEPGCRGCFHRDISLEASLKQKTDWLLKTLSPWKEVFTEISYVDWESQLGYRDKVCLPAFWDGQCWQFGLNHKDEVVPIPDCPLHTERIRKTYRILQQYLPGPELFPLAFYVQSGAQVVLVVKAASIEGVRWKEPFFREMLAAGNEGIWIHLNPTAGKHVFSKTEWQFLFGKQRSLNQLKLMYGPQSFPQIIPELYIESITDTLDFFKLQKGDGVVDLYSGIGSSLVAWTRSGAYGIGVEINTEAVECARMNLVGTLVLRGKCSDRLPHLNEWLEYREVQRRFLYTNPPGAGMEEEVVDWITGSLKPLRIAYQSCSAGTLRTDLEKITANGYKVVRIKPFDFFPRTHHVECLVFLEQE